MEPIVVLRKAVDQTGRIVAGVTSDQLSGPTPCPEWDTRALLNHTIGGVEMFDDATQTKPFTGSMFANDNVGDDPGAVVRATSQGAAGHVGAARCPGEDLDDAIRRGTRRHGRRVRDARVVPARLGCRRASGQQVEFDPDVTATAAATAEMMPAEQVRVPGVFAAEANCPPDASAEDQLAAFLGRQL